MKIGPYVDKLEKSPVFKEFRTGNPDAYVAAGFFVLDLEMGKNIHQIDFYIPSKKKVAAFTLDGDVTLQLMDMSGKKAPEKLDMKTELDLDALPGIVRDEMHNRNMTESIQKMIAVIQNIDGKKIWNINCVLSGMEILKSHVEDASQSVLKIEKISMMDIIKQVPASMLQKQKNAEPSKDLKDELEKLDKLEKEIEKQKEEIKKDLKKAPKKPKKKSSK